MTKHHNFCGVLAFLGFCFSGLSVANQMPPVPIETYQIKPQAVVQGIIASGEIKANRSVIIRPEITAKVQALPMQEGQVVAAGTVLIALHDVDAKANLKQAQAKLDYSKVHYERFQTLAKQGTGSKNDSDNALATMKMDEANVALAQSALAKTQLKAPFDGILGLRHVNLGDYVSPGQELISLDDIDTLIIDFSVPEKHLSTLKIGQEVEVVSESVPDRKLSAKIYAIAPQIDLVTHSIKARARMANPGHLLRPGLFVKLRIVLNKNEHALLIPEQSVVNQNNKTFVYVIRDNKATLSEVTTGQRQNALIEVQQGLNAQDVIAKTGQMKLYDGAAVMDVEKMQ